MSNQIGTLHISTNPASYEVARSNNFEFVVTGVTSLLKAGVSETTAQDADRTGTRANDVVRLSVTKAFVPNFSQEEILIQRGNAKIYAASVPTFEAGNISVNDFIGIDTKSVLLAWQRLSYDITTDKVGRMEDYKKVCTLNEYTPDYVLIRSWTLTGCWVKSITENEFSVEDSGKRMITANIRFDRAIPTDILADRTTL
jgi:hypothetical protein